MPKVDWSRHITYILTAIGLIVACTGGYFTLKAQAKSTKNDVCKLESTMEKLASIQQSQQILLAANEKEDEIVHGQLKEDMKEIKTDIRDIKDFLIKGE